MYASGLLYIPNLNQNPDLSCTKLNSVQKETSQTKTHKSNLVGMNVRKSLPEEPNSEFEIRRAAAVLVVLPRWRTVSTIPTNDHPGCIG